MLRDLAEVVSVRPCFCVFVYAFRNRAVFKRYGSARIGSISALIGVAVLRKGRRSKKNLVPNGAVFSFEDAGHGSSTGVFVTTSSFSAPAMDFVRHLTQRVILFDGVTLANLMIEHDVRVRSRPAGDSPQSAQSADRMPSQKPSIKAPKPRNYRPSTSINGSSIPPRGELHPAGNTRKSLETTTQADRA